MARELGLSAVGKLQVHEELMTNLNENSLSGYIFHKSSTDALNLILVVDSWCFEPVFLI
ncbi:MAG: hypothetical protein L3J46_04090 [Kangiellaceae bacterium]|nr:hypothetical protein [Kangiellaceae bacterium]